MQLLFQLYVDLKKKLDIGHTWAKEVKTASGVIEVEGLSEASQAVGIKHSIRIEVLLTLHDENGSFTDKIMHSGASSLLGLDK